MAYLKPAQLFVCRLYDIFGDGLPIPVQVTCDMKQKYAEVVQVHKSMHIYSKVYNSMSKHIKVFWNSIFYI